jgi:hypothetical protein
MNTLAIFGVSALMSLVSSALIARLTKEEEGFLAALGMTVAFLQSITQIAPPRIHHFDQGSFLGPPPALDFLLPRNGSPGCGVPLEPH